MGTVYANVSDLEVYALPAKTVSGTFTTVAALALQRTSDKISGQLKKRYALPLTTWGADLRGATCEIAAWDLLVIKQFDARDQGNVFKTRAEMAWKWIVDVSNGNGELADVVDQTPSVDESLPAIVTSTKRGW